MHGVGENAAVLVCLIKQICRGYLDDRMRDIDVVSSPNAVIDFARTRLSGEKDELFMAIFLNSKNHIIDWEVLGSGTVDRAVIYPRNIIRHALAANAAAMIFVHNHPSGVCDPSQDDVRLTEEIKKAAETVNIRVLDHIIVGKEGYCSFNERGLM